MAARAYRLSPRTVRHMLTTLEVFAVLFELVSQPPDYAHTDPAKSPGARAGVAEPQPEPELQGSVRMPEMVLGALSGWLQRAMQVDGQ